MRLVERGLPGKNHFAASLTGQTERSHIELPLSVARNDRPVSLTNNVKPTGRLPHASPKRGSSVWKQQKLNVIEELLDWASFVCDKLTTKTVFLDKAWMTGHRTLDLTKVFLPDSSFLNQTHASCLVALGVFFGPSCIPV
ncbi:hypothetical protein L596_017542 [Steinernema carpocapsae]|uniref:Uncharacterized protein n=1 Tax=Steinernema carpocapsae TaxID=34508 RepID=A0A4U5N282_STECR|nr:hypothetical protein L596_017542 [Steinernema carpocapsae]